MPAPPRIPDRDAGALQAFAYDLRELGERKVPIPYIADRSQGNPSRAAFYAALSGTRLPSRATIAALLQWWAGEPAAEDQRPFDGMRDDPHW